MDSVFGKKSQIPQWSARTNKEFSNFCQTNFRAIALVIFDSVRIFCCCWKTWKSTQVVCKFVDTKQIIWKNGWNQNLCLVVPIIIVYFIFAKNPLQGVVIANDPKNLENIFEDLKIFNNSKITPCCDTFYYPWIVSSEKKHIPQWSAWKDEEFGNLTFIFFTLLSDKLLSDQFSNFPF